MHFTYLFLHYLLTVLAWAHTALYLVLSLLWYEMKAPATPEFELEVYS